MTKEESDGGENKESEEVAAQTTGHDGVGTKWRRWPWSLFQGYCDWRGEDL